jgi:hypothetical protein
MAKSVYKAWGDKIRQSGFILPLALALVAGCLITVVTGVNDYYTSFRGVERLSVNATLPDPTSFELTLATLRQYAIAGMPQVLSVVLGFTILTYLPNRKDRRETTLWLSGLAVFLISNYVDINTGYHYYITSPFNDMSMTEALGSPVGRKAVGDALLMSIIVDTLFSEIGGSFLWGLLFEVYPDAIKQFNKVFGREDPMDELARQITPQGQGKKGSGAKGRGTQGRQRPIPPPDVRDAIARETAASRPRGQSQGGESRPNPGALRRGR